MHVSSVVSAFLSFPNNPFARVLGLLIGSHGAHNHLILLETNGAKETDEWWSMQKYYGNSLYNDKALVLIQPTDIYVNCDQTDELRLISEIYQWDR